ncbi:SAM-dependent methyltransferase [Halanaeroarchaeum sp. HSR-CO]|uniref:class I SAM-dependent methyltransferase n=1 Tax=Halanaeroarchaeum sp. HSR-CO TaxID=2866382 RepID=UPI00217EBE7B|nr:class I SAM-dependent methyltransferase [Halanaeroarchaeum sp. HSR-CO]UWG48211.1 SAM-dependent methyltransferase [Halanaeroarchaeum sp. HSR-CO]
MSEESAGSDTTASDVVATYDEIAAHFATKRKNPWPEVTSFLDGVESTTALDVGCANGRHTELLAAVADRAIGLDASRALLSEAESRRDDHNFDAILLQGDASRLPLREDSVDLATYVATMHHLPTREARVESLDELARVLTPAGRALVSVWSTEHDRFDETQGFDTTVTFTMPDGRAVPRYYHIYDPSEFGTDLEASAVGVEREWVSNGNCYAVVTGSE